jgi:predicted RNase H-like HicB family nuclease
MQQFYLAIIEKAKGGFGVFFPDLPGCTSFGPTLAKAAENAYVAAQAHAAVSQEYGEELPPPRDPDRIEIDPDVTEKARLLVPVETSDEPVRVNISLSASALAALDRTAKELALTRSGAIAHLALTREATSSQFARRRPGRANKRTAGRTSSARKK